MSHGELGLSSLGLMLSDFDRGQDSLVLEAAFQLHCSMDHKLAK
jgi:hypothetical protein